MGNVTNNRKVLLFTSTGVGGAERMVCNIGGFLHEAGFEVVFVIEGYRLGKIVDFIPKDCRIIHLKVRNVYDFLTLRVINLLRKERPDVVFSTHLWMNPRLLVAASIVGGIKKIVRNANYTTLSPKLTQLMCRLTYNMADVIIAQQDEMKEDIVYNLHVPASMVLILQNPLDTDTVNNRLQNVENPFRTDDAINYVSVARFAPIKGQDLLAAAFVHVFNTLPKAHLYFIGDCESQPVFVNKVKKIIAENNMQDRVHLVGYDKNPYRWVKYCDCFVLPSRLEGLPNSLIEAQYLGRPCVAVECIPIIKRIISEGVNGYTVPMEDIKALGNAMIDAPKLGNVTMTYQPSNKEDFVNVFKL